MSLTRTTSVNPPTVVIDGVEYTFKHKETLKELINAVVSGLLVDVSNGTSF